MAAVVSPDDLPLLAPRRRLSGKRLPDQKQTMSLVGHSIFWGGVARIDVLQVCRLKFIVEEGVHFPFC
jgi:hypothetical protein